MSYLSYVNGGKINTRRGDHWIVVECITNNIAKVSIHDDATNEEGQHVPGPQILPKGYVMEDNSSKTLVEPYSNVFFIAWLYNYTLLFNGTVVLRLKHQKQQDIELF